MRSEAQLTHTVAIQLIIGRLLINQARYGLIMLNKYNML